MNNRISSSSLFNYFDYIDYSSDSEAIGDNHGCFGSDSGLYSTSKFLESAENKDFHSQKLSLKRAFFHGLRRKNFVRFSVWSK